MSKKVTRKKEKHIPQRKRGNYRAPSTEKRKRRKKRRKKKKKQQ